MVTGSYWLVKDFSVVGQFPISRLVGTNPPEDWLRSLPGHRRPSSKRWRVSNLQEDSDEYLVANPEESHHKCSIRRRLGTAKPSFSFLICPQTLRPLLLLPMR